MHFIFQDHPVLTLVPFRLQSERFYDVNWSVKKKNFKAFFIHTHKRHTRTFTNVSKLKKGFSLLFLFIYKILTTFLSYLDIFNVTDDDTGCVTVLSVVYSEWAYIVLSCHYHNKILLYLLFKLKNIHWHNDFSSVLDQNHFLSKLTYILTHTVYYYY